MNTVAVEKFLSPKELTESLGDIGIVVHIDWTRELIAHSPRSACRCLRLSDAIVFLQSHPDFAPHSEQWQRLKNAPRRPGIRVL